MDTKYEPVMKSMIATLEGTKQTKAYVHFGIRDRHAAEGPTTLRDASDPGL